jgi:hypothetical protein
MPCEQQHRLVSNIPIVPLGRGHTFRYELVLRGSERVMKALLHIHHVPEGLELLPKHASFPAYRLVVKLAHRLARVREQLVKLSMSRIMSCRREPMRAVCARSVMTELQDAI